MHGIAGVVTREPRVDEDRQRLTLGIVIRGSASFIAPMMCSSKAMAPMLVAFI
jgi:hypothetical protein